MQPRKNDENLNNFRNTIIGGELNSHDLEDLEQQIALEMLEGKDAKNAAKEARSIILRQKYTQRKTGKRIYTFADCDMNPADDDTLMRSTGDDPLSWEDQGSGEVVSGNTQAACNGSRFVSWGEPAQITQARLDAYCPHCKGQRMHRRNDKKVRGEIGHCGRRGWKPGCGFAYVIDEYS